jgi:rod shape-determining protein MreC
MRAFFQFLRRFSHLLIFLGLEGLCFFLIARSKSLQGADVLSSANAVTGSLYKKQQAITAYFNLPAMNDSLLHENARLRDLITARAYEIDTLRDSAAAYQYEEPRQSSLDSTRIIRYAQYTYRMARVVNNSVTERNNFVTIARGTADGIKVGQAVLSGSGIVGKIVYASAHFASAISILSDRQPVSGRLTDGTIGTVRWRYGSPDMLEMESVPGELKVYRGDSVLTTAYSFAPPDVVIGTVVRLRRIKRNNSQTLLLRSATNFRNLQYVYVVENSFADEKNAVEDSARATIRPVNNRRP